jgi:hypothetical protein
MESQLMVALSSSAFLIQHLFRGTLLYENGLTNPKGPGDTALYCIINQEWDVDDSIPDLKGRSPATPLEDPSKLVHEAMDV